jgi:hypothetical protein
MHGDIRPPRRKKINPQPKIASLKPAPALVPAVDLDMPVPDISIDLPDDPKPKKSKGIFAKFQNFVPYHKWYELSRQEKMVAGGGALLVVAGIIAAVYFLFIQSTPVTSAPVITKVEPPKPTTIAAPLTGLQIDPSLATRPVTGIMIENSPDARPQSGLQDAGVVFEAIAEGGITRFVTLFQDTQPSYIGPVRSLRPYYLDFALPFDASIAHVGGSPDALAQVRSGGPIDLDQFFNADTYWRQSTRDAPHNVYTSFAKLDGLNQLKGHLTSKFTSWQRKKDQPSKTPAAKSIDLSISSFYFNVHYDWDAASNSYLRSEGGKPHLSTSSADNSTGQQLHPKVVIVPIMTYSVLDSSGHSGYGVDGSGSVYIFQDGGVTQGTWSKAGRSSQFQFKDTAGNDIKLNAGQTWVTVLSDPSQVTYAP